MRVDHKNEVYDKESFCRTRLFHFSRMLVYEGENMAQRFQDSHTMGRKT